MRLRTIIHATLAVAAGSAIGAWPGVAAAQTGGFTVGDIRIEGLQRISEGTVYNYLPVNIGDQLDQRRVAESMRALYATGFFRDVDASVAKANEKVGDAAERVTEWLKERR